MHLLHITYAGSWRNDNEFMEWPLCATSIAIRLDQFTSFICAI